ncbi:hypothetical protein L2X99_00660 [Microbacterium sp. KUDC0406]|uniref:hypothetical protein n=1 Tax=Microbacterium sp. KUDC0406 TaxID=2909588 RepID=UPI001F4841A0|nr:hypothetical protein [Microbacterium sp. KUDC0406]UJP10269.1 hypothetical protein L2X99_00660 [Microbacterium sp. KUDC0406]
MNHPPAPIPLTGASDDLLPGRPATLDDLLARRAGTLRASADAAGERGWRPDDDVDWSRLALRLRTAIELGEELLLEIVADDDAPLVIDVAGRTFWWDRPLAEFPARLQTLVISPLEPRGYDPGTAGNDLEPLLWQIAHASFDGGRARWLKPGDRYRLRRWPNLTALPHDAEQVRAMSLLGQAALTAEEFSAIAEIEDDDAVRLLSALSLMGLLRVQPAREATAAPRPVLQPRREGGLFARLRGLFGR